MLRVTKNGCTKDKGKEIDTTFKGKDPSIQEVIRDTKVQSMIDSTWGLAKEVDTILFGVEGGQELYDEWVDT